ncbi:hypothetical protein MRX96_029084 [Rhipicephalus microplus]
MAAGVCHARLAPGPGGSQRWGRGGTGSKGVPLQPDGGASAQQRAAPALLLEIDRQAPPRGPAHAPSEEEGTWQARVRDVAPATLQKSCSAGMRRSKTTRLRVLRPGPCQRRAAGL